MDNLKILIIEDNTGDYRLLLENLNDIANFRYSNDRAIRISEAIELGKKNDYDIIISDLSLPDSDYDNTLNQLTKHFSHLPLVVLTGSYSEELGVEAIKRGVQDYILKDEMECGLLHKILLYAIERKHHEEDLKSYKDELELKVLERTRELKKNERKFKKLFNNASDLIFLHEIRPEGPGKFIEVNDTACEKLGYSREELLEKTVADISSPHSLEIQDGVIKDLLDKRITTFETHQLKKDGSLLPVEVHAHVFKLEEKRVVLSICRDITERLKSAKRIRDSERMYRLLADNTVDCIWVMNKDGVFEYVNPAITSISGYTANEWIGVNIADHIDSKDIQTIDDLIFNTLREGKKQFKYNLEFKKKNGSKALLENTGKILLDDNGNIMTIQGVTRDITQRRLMEMEQKALLEELQKAHNELESFVQTLYHEMQTPLSTIGGYLDIINETMDDGDINAAKIYVEVIKSAATKISQESKKLGRAIRDDSESHEEGDHLKVTR
ncbi:MAG TPA: PAS domain S-box protein [Candidatus Methanofastidiosa archaeon]|nr:PAS domain S-box protein [Candidatus Methanofastidiosa archaeon]